MRLPRATRQVLTTLGSLDANVKHLAGVVRKNPLIERMLLEEFKQRSKAGSSRLMQSLEAVLTGLGVQRVRNLVCAAQVQSIEGAEAPEQKIRYALQSDALGYEHLFAAGLVYDRMRFVIKSEFSTSATILQTLDQNFQVGLRSALITAELVSHLKGFSLARFAPAAALLKDAGKVVLAIIHGQNYSSHLGLIQRQGLSRILAHFVEEKRFGLSHECFSSELIACLGLFPAEVERGVLFHHEPYLLNKGSRDTYWLASVLALSSNIEKNVQFIGSSIEEAKRRCFTTELKGFELISAEQALQAALRIGTLT
jgi:HD-like signal output (HDOD) protein